MPNNMELILSSLIAARDRLDANTQKFHEKLAAQKATCPAEALPLLDELMNADVDEYIRIRDGINKRIDDIQAIIESTK